MDASEFLFPRDLAVTATPIRRVLLLGSCLAFALRDRLRDIAPGVTFDLQMFNNVADLPPISPEQAASYDFQSIHLPLRHVLSDDVIDVTGFLREGAAEAILDRARQTLGVMLGAALKYNTEHNMLTFVANFSAPQVAVAASLDDIGSARDLAWIITELNVELARLIRGRAHVYVADINAIGNSLGKRHFHDDVIGFYSHAYYWDATNLAHDMSPDCHAPMPGRIETLPPLEQVYESRADQMFGAVWRQMECLYRTVHQIDMVKLVIFDLDDTLWRGQIAEHYADGANWPVIHGWPVGMWEAVQHLRARGIMTAICSRNDEGLVRTRWSRAVSQPWLAMDDFLFREINFRPKAENVARIIGMAHVTARSTVFVDDNPVERESVTAALPGLRAIGANPYVTRRILLWSPETQVARRSIESAGREQSMRQIQARDADRAASSKEEFLRGLDCRLRLFRIESRGHDDFARAIELLNKTNQFNTTGRRWSLPDIARFLDQDGEIFAFSVADRFTQYGLVGVIVYQAGTVTQFAMSCRVLGLEIETSALNALLAMLSPERQDGFRAQVIETEANMVCRDIFARCGFAPLAGPPGAWVHPGGEFGPVASHLRVEQMPGARPVFA